MMARQAGFIPGSGWPRRRTMRITAIRRFSQVFFLLLFLWFCVVTTLGERVWELRGWPVNWFLQLDPLVALGTALTTRTLYAGLLWAVATVALTIVLGRFFCGWLCPFGTLHHIVGWLGRRRRKLAEQLKVNAYRPAQSVKYYLLSRPGR
jgi:polyferredoxin